MLNLPSTELSQLNLKAPNNSKRSRSQQFHDAPDKDGTETSASMANDKLKFLAAVKAGFDELNRGEGKTLEEVERQIFHSTTNQL